MLKSPEKYFDNVSACSRCYSCNNVCLVKIDLADQIYRWRQNLYYFSKADPVKKVMSDGMKFIFSHPSIYNISKKIATIENHIPHFLIYNGLNEWGKERKLPKCANESFTSMWKKGKVQESSKKKS